MSPCLHNFSVCLSLHSLLSIIVLSKSSRLHPVPHRSVVGKFYLISLHWPVYVNRSMRERHSCFCLLTPAVSHISCSSYFVDERLSAVELKLFDLLIPGFV